MSKADVEVKQEENKPKTSTAPKELSNIVRGDELSMWTLEQINAGLDPYQDPIVKAAAYAMRIRGLWSMSGGRIPKPLWQARLACADAILRDKKMVGGQRVFLPGESTDLDTSGAAAWEDRVSEEVDEP